jgi:hypothetical protein
MNKNHNKYDIHEEQSDSMISSSKMDDSSSEDFESEEGSKLGAHAKKDNVNS